MSNPNVDLADRRPLPDLSGSRTLLGSTSLSIGCGVHLPGEYFTFTRSGSVIVHNLQRSTLTQMWPARPPA